MGKKHKQRNITSSTEQQTGVLKEPKVRLDQHLVSLSLVASREKAQALIMAGEVLVNEQRVDKPGTLILPTAKIHLKESSPYVGRGALKLAHALDSFGQNPQGLLCLDIGASTGGFTDVLLQRGARHVFAVDVGSNQLDYRLRIDPRVTVLEKTNARYLEALPGLNEEIFAETGQGSETRAKEILVDLAVIDVSFISLRLIIPTARRLLKPTGLIICLIKPQFEAGRQQVGKGGIIRDPEIHREVLIDLVNWAKATGLPLLGLTASPILGTEGNREFLAWFAPQATEVSFDALETINMLIEQAKETTLPKNSVKTTIALE